MRRPSSVTIVPSSTLKTVDGPPCTVCRGSEYVVLGDMAYGIVRAECLSCGETQYIPKPKTSS